MQSAVTWMALIAALAAITGLVTFWVNRGRAEQEALSKAQDASNRADRAEAIAIANANNLTTARIEFARDYATHRDTAATESRLADAINTLRTELRADIRVVMDRLDRH